MAENIEAPAWPVCPTCGGDAIGTVERLDGVALFARAEDGFAIYSGTTEINWEGQETVELDGCTLLTCGKHEFKAPEGFKVS